MYKLTFFIIFVSFVTAQNLKSSHTKQIEPIPVFVSTEKCLDYRIIYPRNDPLSFKFELDSPGTVNIMIYSLEYKFIRGLVSKQLYNGSQTIYWDGLDENGEIVKENVYLHICKQIIL